VLLKVAYKQVMLYRQLKSYLPPKVSLCRHVYTKILSPY
jgi:hypothetical protein